MRSAGRLTLACVAGVIAACTRHAPPGDHATERIAANDNRRPAGTMRGGVLTLELELRRGRWYPDADDGPSIEVQAFGEAGHALQIPGPLIRVSEGTELQIRIRNTLRDSTLVVHGLHPYSTVGDDSLVIAPGARRDVRFTAGTPGTYFYWASTTGHSMDVRDGEDSQLGGAFIVDPRDGAPPDRVFVIGLWFDPGDSLARPPRSPRDVMAINGKSWPHTERFDLAQGDTVRWRWINQSSSSHPMHLHGFYFAVDSRGDWLRDTVYTSDQRPLAVTELMLPGGTMAMRWAPIRPGNWIFHCHFAFHVSPFVSLTSGDAAQAEARGGPPAAPHEHTAERSMAGLVLGIRVAPAPGAAPAGESREAPREIRLLAQSARRRFGEATGYGFVVQRGAEPARDSIEIPGPPLVLERGKPVRITVVNRLAEPTAVHWHGIELESYPDGVPGWSGVPPRLMPAIAPGDSFVAAFTPPRAGTFIYPAHAHEDVQLSQGMYGALLVVEPGHLPDPEVERLILVSLAGPSGTNAGGLINGSTRPAPIELVTGRRHRLRLININPDDRVRFSLVRDTTLVPWRAVAKDGADLPAAQATSRPARLLTGPGETADFEVLFVRPDSLTLLVEGPYADRPWTMSVPVLVRPAKDRSIGAKPGTHLRHRAGDGARTRDIQPGKLEAH